MVSFKELTPYIIYRVTKGTSSGSISKDDLFYLDREEDFLVFPRYSKQIKREEIDIHENADFAYEPDPRWEVIRTSYSNIVRQVE